MSFFSQPASFNVVATTDLFVYTLPFNKLEALRDRYLSVIDKIIVNTVSKNKTTINAMKSALTPYLK